jgi:hypothetical protein
MVSCGFLLDCCGKGGAFAWSGCQRIRARILPQAFQRCRKRHRVGNAPLPAEPGQGRVGAQCCSRDMFSVFSLLLFHDTKVQFHIVISAVQQITKGISLLENSFHMSKSNMQVIENKEIYLSYMSYIRPGIPAKKRLLFFHAVLLRFQHHVFRKTVTEAPPLNTFSQSCFIT